MTTTVEQSISHIMQSRSSVRAYEKGKTIPIATLQDILKLAATAPSSWNLQHWKFIVVQDQQIKERLLPIAYSQQQVVDASAVIIVLGDVQANKNAEMVYGEAVKGGYMTEEAKGALLKNIERAYASSETVGVHEAIRNASFAVMQLMLAAKAYDLDTCPMGGFDPIALRQELNIPDRYIPVLMLTLGYAAKPAHPTSRFDLKDLVIKDKF